MQPASSYRRRHAAALLLAGVACLAHSLGSCLPEPVVCLRSDRPAQGELFSRSCSCRHEDHDPGEPAAAEGRRVAPACVDVLLDSPALPAASGRVPGPERGSGRRFAPVPLPAGMPLLPAAFAAPAGHRPQERGSPPCGSPHSLPALRC
jgi:hypothetical protein